jgi:DNA-binding response OmpR family regulator
MTAVALPVTGALASVLRAAPAASAPRTSFEVTLPDSPTAKEFSLLEYLLRSARRAAGRHELLRTVWRGSMPADGSRTIDVHVRRLREKLGGCLEAVTVRGVGYRFDPSPDVVLVGSGDAG